MEWLFGRRMTPDEMLRKNQRALNKAMRELDRERTKMEQQEKKIIADIKKMAKQGQMDAVKIMAKDLVRYQVFDYSRKSLFTIQVMTVAGADKKICQKVYVDESQYPSCVPEDSDP